MHMNLISTLSLEKPSLIFLLVWTPPKSSEDNINKPQMPQITLKNFEIIVLNEVTVHLHCFSIFCVSQMQPDCIVGIFFSVDKKNSGKGKTKEKKRDLS